MNSSTVLCLSTPLAVWLCTLGDENKKKIGILTAETPGPSSLPGYHIKKLQGRKVMLSGRGRKQGMLSHK